MLPPGPACGRPHAWAEGLGSRGAPGLEALAVSARTYCYPNNELYFRFSKRLCFHLKRCCLPLFDLNKVKDNRIQMKYISILILHRESLL